ncbi:hypothetical protein [Vibrio gigantis]|uniref:Uncharacterized protein n=1 Tax=Vibrio gigantis TaxID=296199 RepID=A0A5M9P1I5_9VIBR|nr:hypothetical protein [Vibrio gigantis]KAA8678600.1 hypothetical protein F4W18_07685 [Vibrio gigantis]
MCIKDVTSVVISYPPVGGTGNIFLSFLWEKLDFKSVFFWLYAISAVLGVVNVIPLIRKKLPNLLCLQYSVSKLSSPACTSALHFIVIIVTIYFSVTSSAIDKWLTEDKLITGNVAIVFSWVVSLLCLSIIIFVLNQKSIGKKRTQDEDGRQESYEIKVKALEDIIRFAPPNGFAKVLSEYVDVADDFGKEINKQHNQAKILDACSFAYKHFLDVPGKPPSFVFKGFEAIKPYTNNAVNLKNEMKEAIDSLKKQTDENAKYIRAILIAYARLAAHFEGVTPSERDKDIYRATLMLKYDAKDLRLGDKDNIKYVPAILTKTNLDKFLTLHKEHSVKAYSGKMNITQKANNKFVPIDFKPDDEISTTYMPFFLGEERANYNCIGAPRVLGTCESQFINNVINEIEGWRGSDKSPIEIVDEAKEYFSKQNKPFSLMSFPLMHSRYDVEHKSAQYILGVVTISRDKKAMMMEEESKLEQFEHITTPLNFALCKIVHFDALHRYHINLLQEILDSVSIGSSDVGSSSTQQDSA